MIQRFESKEQNSDVFAKGLPEEAFQYTRKLLVGW